MAKKKKAAKQRTEPPKVKASASVEIDAELAATALEKRRNGERPTRDELAGLRRHEAAEEENKRWQYYATIPKKHLRELTGRATEQLHRVADRHGAPLRGRTIDLGQLLAWVFEFIERHKAAIESSEEPRSAELERLRRAQADKVEIQNREKLGSLRNVEQVYALLDFVGNQIRKASEEIRQRFGDGPADVLQDAVKRGWNRYLHEYPPAGQVDAGEDSDQVDQKGQ